MNKNTALVIIDVQVELFEEPVYKEEQLLDNISSLIEKARLSNTPIIYIQHTEKEDGPMLEGKEGWKIHPRIAPIKGDITVLKYTPDSFHETNLQEVLNSMGIKNLVIAGLQTEYCIDTTCRSAFRLGYSTILVKDGHSTYDTDMLAASQIVRHHNTVLSDWFVELKSTEEISF